MMLTIYGSMLCPDCFACREALDRAGVCYVYKDFSDDLNNLKDFLKLRENALFEPVRERGSIGIPCLVTEDGTITLDWQKWINENRG